MNTTDPTRTRREPTTDEILRDVAFALRLAMRAAQDIRNEAARVNPATPRIERDPQPVVAV